MSCCLESDNDIIFTNIRNVHNTLNKVDKILTQDFNNAKYINKIQIVLIRTYTYLIKTC